MNWNFWANSGCWIENKFFIILTNFSCRSQIGYFLLKVEVWRTESCCNWDLKNSGRGVKMGSWPLDIPKFSSGECLPPPRKNLLPLSSIAMVSADQTKKVCGFTFCVYRPDGFEMLQQILPSYRICIIQLPKFIQQLFFPATHTLSNFLLEKLLNQINDKT